MRLIRLENCFNKFPRVFSVRNVNNSEIFCYSVLTYKQINFNLSKNISKIFFSYKLSFLGVFILYRSCGLTRNARLLFMYHAYKNLFKPIWIYFISFNFLSSERLFLYSNRVLCIIIVEISFSPSKQLYNPSSSIYL